MNNNQQWDIPKMLLEISNLKAENAKLIGTLEDIKFGMMKIEEHECAPDVWDWILTFDETIDDALNDVKNGT